MSIHLYNTLTGRKDEFKPIEKGEVKMYSCGPTVYDYAHIGNLRAYVFTDVLRRTLEYNGYKVKQVMNITDVGHLTSDADDGDDKMIKALKRDNLPLTLEAMRQVADKYTDAFKQDLKALNCEIPDEMPRASDNIAEDIELIKILEQKGFAYKTSGGVYFDISKYPEYGKLGKIKLAGQLSGARVDINSEKKNPADFSLWKISRNDIGWPSPWGKGFPGWHIECSAMSRKYLGQPFDIHTGGIDHIPVHHNNEIAQSEAAFGAPLANYWMHNAFVNTDEGKMAKSSGDFLTLKNLGYEPLDYRYFLLNARYSTPINFHVYWLDQFANALRNLKQEILELEIRNEGKGLNTDTRPLEIISDDLDTHGLITAMWSVIKSEESANQKLSFIQSADKILGLKLLGQSETVKIPKKIQKLLEARDVARAAKDWKKSDGLRAEIEKAGFTVEDTESGSKVIPKI